VGRFDVDKTEMMKVVLDTLGVNYSPNKVGYQQIRCPNSDAHAHGDRNPSASLHLGHGRVKCFTCDLSGDAFDVAEKLGMTLDTKGLEVEESVWII
jgi:hypothetical protein